MSDPFDRTACTLEPGKQYPARANGYHKVHTVVYSPVLMYSDWTGFTHGAFRALCGVRGGNGYGGHMVIDKYKSLEDVDCQRCSSYK